VPVERLLTIKNFATCVANLFPIPGILQGCKLKGAELTTRVYIKMVFKMIINVFFARYAFFLDSSELYLFQGMVSRLVNKFSIVKKKIFLHKNILFTIEVIWMCHPMFLALRILLDQAIYVKVFHMLLVIY
jgi:hypothetical protein